MTNEIAAKGSIFAGRNPKRLVFLGVLSLAIFFCGCTTIPLKITTIRPTEIVRIVVEDLSSEEPVELIRDTDSETDWLMDDLILQFEEKFTQTGSCSDDDAHRYHVMMYRNGDSPEEAYSLELELYIHQDASVCQYNQRKVQDKDAYNTLDMNVWAALFDQ